MSTPIELKVKRKNENVSIPAYAKEGDAGFDLYADESVLISPGQTAIIKTGLYFEIPVGYEIQIRPRSGISSKTKLRTHFGTIDSGYRGEVGVVMYNDEEQSEFSSAMHILPDGELIGLYEYEEDGFDIKESEMMTYYIPKGTRIAQAVVNELPKVKIKEVNELSDSERGGGGFGSTGIEKDKTK